MNYLLLIYNDQKKFAKLPESDREKVMKDFRAFTESIVKSGHYRAGEQLAPVSTATTVRGKNGRAVTTDGPYVETKEQLGGYYLVEARDLDEAVALAKRIPTVGLDGGVEVRPIVPRSKNA
jgi:hypothetical protein